MPSARGATLGFGLGTSPVIPSAISDASSDIGNEMRSRAGSGRRLQRVIALALRRQKVTSAEITNDRRARESEPASTCG